MLLIAHIVQNSVSKKHFMQDNNMLTGFASLILFLVCGKCLAERCQQSELALCMEHVKPIMQNATLGFAANAEQLNNVCRLFNQGMECIDRFTAKCFPESQRNLFKQNMAGVEKVMRRLCTDDGYRREYLQHAACFRRMAPQYEECGTVFRTSVQTINQNRDINTQEKLSQMCGALHQFLECGYNLTSQHCGTENGTSAAKFLRTYTEKSIGSLIRSTCRKPPAANQLTSSSNPVVEIDKEDGLHEVSPGDLSTALPSTTPTASRQDDLTLTILISTTPATSSSTRVSRRTDGTKQLRSNVTTPSKGAPDAVDSLQATAASGAETTPPGEAVQLLRPVPSKFSTLEIPL